MAKDPIQVPSTDCAVNMHMVMVHDTAGMILLHNTCKALILLKLFTVGLSHLLVLVLVLANMYIYLTAVLGTWYLKCW